MKHIRASRTAIMAGLGILIIAAGAAIYYENTKESPTEKNLRVPFTPQAPAGDWREPWKNACEETSIIMIDNFYAGDDLAKREAEQEILNIFSIKEKEFGTSKDESMERVAEIINTAKLAWRARVVTNPSRADIQEQIARSRPVIAPVDAQLLDNPIYDGTGLRYHVLVISGYDDAKQEFIVQDPGTSRGQNFRYNYETLMNAIQDYLETDSSKQRKAVLFTMPK